MLMNFRHPTCFDLSYLLNSTRFFISRISLLVFETTLDSIYQINNYYSYCNMMSLVIFYKLFQVRTVKNVQERKFDGSAV